MNRTQYAELVMREDCVGTEAVGRALVHLLRRQTHDEQQDATTRHHNNIGFTGADGRRGVITAKYFIKHKTLQDWQLEYWRTPNRKGVPRIVKYYAQIAEEANRIKLQNRKVAV